MVTCTTTVAVRAIALRPKLMRVNFKGGSHLVAGGRLLQETLNGVTVNHPDLPEYSVDMFPVKAFMWADGDFPEVTVEAYRKGRMVRFGRIMAFHHLFSALPADEVREYIRSYAK